MNLVAMKDNRNKRILKHRSTCGSGWRILKHRSTYGSGCQKDLRAGAFGTLRCLRSAFVSCVMVVVALVVAQATHARFSKYMLTKVRSEGSHIINMLTIIVFGEDFGL